MTSLEGIFRATIQINGVQSPVLFVLKGGRFEGFDLDDRRYRGEYRLDEETNDVVMTTEVSFPAPLQHGEPLTRLSRSLTVRIPLPPDEPGVLLATELDLDEAQGSVVIERLTDMMP
jgi:hypothetical protein